MLLLSNSFSSCGSTEHSFDEREAMAVAVRDFGDSAAFDFVNVTVQGWARHAAAEVALRIVFDEEGVRVPARFRGFAFDHLGHLDLENGFGPETHTIETEA